MKIAYFDCYSGAAGDMIIAAALDAGLSADILQRELAQLNLKENFDLQIKSVNKNGIAATSFTPVLTQLTSSNPDNHRHRQTTSHNHIPHRNLSDITVLIEQSDLKNSIKSKALNIFQRLAQAEAKVHGTSIDKVHFHEVGATDAIIDIVGACIALEELGIDRIYCSPLTVGSGTVRCAHNVVPVPAPATAELIKNIEITPTNIKKELLTPTGAAILTTLATEFGPMPNLTIVEIGYGAGQLDLDQQANVLRLILGESIDRKEHDDEVCLMETNIDDATGELIGHVTETLLQAGALDVFCTAIVMKKNRPGIKISVISPPNNTDKLEKILFRESTTFGVRKHLCQRSTLIREHKTVPTRYGPVRMKLGFLEGKIITESVEFSDCLQAARQHQVSVKMVISAANAAYHNPET